MSIASVPLGAMSSVAYNSAMQPTVLRTVGSILWGLALFVFLGGRTGFAVVLGVLGTLVLAVSGSSGTAREATPATPIDLDDTQLTEVLGLLDDGRKIEAIRRVREASGAGLKESKDFVDTIQGS